MGKKEAFKKVGEIFTDLQKAVEALRVVETDMDAMAGVDDAMAHMVAALLNYRAGLK